MNARSKQWLRILVCMAALDCNALPAFANFAMSPSGATTMFAVDAANQGTSLCAAASTECAAHVLINTAGAPIGVAATPLQVSLANTGANGTAVTISGTVAATQATASNLKAQVDPLTSANWGLGAFAAAMPANGQGVGLFDGTNMVRAKGDETSGIWVNIKAGAGSGGTAIADKAAWTVGTTNLTPIGGEFTTSGATACASGQACAAGLTADRSIFVNLQDYAGAPISTSNPIPVQGVGIANGTAFGSQTFSAVMGLASTNAPTATTGDLWALSISPASGGVRMDLKDTASNTNPFLVNVASGGIASGAFAAGSFVNATAGDPCMFQAKTPVPISTASGTTALVTGVSAKKIYVCSLALVIPSAVSVSLAEGSSSTCGTSNQAAVMGVATNGSVGNGMPFAANGGISYGNGGGTVAQTATVANYLCLFQSGTAQIAGNMMVVQQ